MIIFLTGATGYIGSSIGKYLVQNGYTVYGLLRNSEKAEKVRALGIIPVLGTLENSMLLARYTKMADAVIHTADADHRASIETMISAMEGTGKTFIHTSGSSVVGDDVMGDFENPHVYREDSPFVPMDVRSERVAINTMVRLAGINKKIRTIVIAPSMIYGDSLGLDVQSDQLPVIYQKSKQFSKGVHVGKGINRWSNVHITDLANLYLLALQKAPSGSYFYAENGEESYKDLSEFISCALGFKGETMSWKAEDAVKELGDWARYALGSNSRVRAVNARYLLGWAPNGPSIRDWIFTHTL